MAIKATTERTMPAAHKAKISASAKARNKPLRMAHRTLMDIISSGVAKAHNQMPTDQFNTLLREAARVQVQHFKLGPQGLVDTKIYKKNPETGKSEWTGETRLMTKPLSWSSLSDEDRVELQKAIKRGTVLHFTDIDGNPIGEVEVEEDVEGDEPEMSEGEMLAKAATKNYHGRAAS